jgi:hypothetical protein
VKCKLFLNLEDARLDINYKLAGSNEGLPTVFHEVAVDYWDNVTAILSLEDDIPKKHFVGEGVFNLTIIERVTLFGSHLDATYIFNKLVEDEYDEEE